MLTGFPSSAFWPTFNAMSVRDLCFPSCSVKGAENTAIILESFFNSLTRLIIRGIRLPSIPIALPPNFAITRFFKT